MIERGTNGGGKGVSATKQTNRVLGASRARIPTDSSDDTNGQRENASQPRVWVFAFSRVWAVVAVVAVDVAALRPARGAHDGEVSPWASVKC